MKKKIKNFILLFTLIISFSFSFEAFAYQWLESNGNWYVVDVNLNPVWVTGWKWIGYNGDTYCFYFDNSGILQTSTTTPDGYKVNGDGCWVDDNDNPISKSDYDSGNYSASTNSGGSSIGQGETWENPYGTTTIENGISPIYPFSKLESIGGDGSQFDLFGIYMARTALKEKGNDEFLSNDSLLDEFEEKLKILKYSKTEEWVEWIENLKKLANIVRKAFTNKPTMQRYEDVMEARVKRENIMKGNIIKDIMYSIIRFLGFCLVFYAIILFICGIIDEVGIFGKYLTGWLSFGAINKSELDTKEGGLIPYPFKFRSVYVSSAVLLLLLGCFMASPSLQAILINYMMKFINWIRGILPGNLPGQVKDAVQDIREAGGVN